MAADDDESTSAPARRAATFDELRALEAMWAATPRVRTWSLLLVGSGVGVVAAAATMRNTGSAVARGVALGGLILGGLCFAAFLAVFVRRVVRSVRMRKLLLVADPARTPAVPLTEGDRLGGWVTLESAAGRLHVARAQSLAWFRLARAAALLTAAGLLIAIAAVVVARISSGGFKVPLVRLIVGAGAASVWLGRFALTRSAYQWTVDDGELVLQDAALFGASRLKSLRAEQVKGFEADTRELRIKLADGDARPLAGLGGSGAPLAGWRAASVATTLAVLMDLRTELRVEDAAGLTSVVRIPAEFADAVDLSASTSALLHADDDGRTP